MLKATEYRGKGDCYFYLPPKLYSSDVIANCKAGLFGGTWQQQPGGVGAASAGAATTDVAPSLSEPMSGSASDVGSHEL